MGIIQFILAKANSQVVCSSCRIIDESPRWLVSKGRLAEAEKTLRRAASLNKTSNNLPADLSLLLDKTYKVCKFKDNYINNYMHDLDPEKNVHGSLLQLCIINVLMGEICENYVIVITLIG